MAFWSAKALPISPASVFVALHMSYMSTACGVSSFQFLRRGSVQANHVPGLGHSSAFLVPSCFVQRTAQAATDRIILRGPTAQRRRIAGCNMAIQSWRVASVTASYGRTARLMSGTRLLREMTLSDGDFGVEDEHELMQALMRGEVELSSLGLSPEDESELLKLLPNIKDGIRQVLPYGLCLHECLRIPPSACVHQARNSFLCSYSFNDPTQTGVSVSHDVRTFMLNPFAGVPDGAPQSAGKTGEVGEMTGGSGQGREGLKRMNVGVKNPEE